MSNTQQHTRPLTNIRYLTERELAEMLGVSIRTLQGWRCRSRGPRYYKLSGDAVRYRLDEAQAWAESNASGPEAA